MNIFSEILYFCLHLASVCLWKLSNDLKAMVMIFWEKTTDMLLVKLVFYGIFNLLSIC